MAALAQHPSEVALRFGDCVALFCEQDDGFVASEGFSDLRVFLHRRDAAHTSIPNFKSAVFELRPPEVFEAATEFDKAMQQFGFASSEELEDEGADPAHMTEAEMGSLFDEYNRLKVAVEREEVRNKEQSERMLSHRITYGQTVQLRHVTSRKFLQCKGDEAAEGDEDALRVSVDKACLQGLWRVMPLLKLHSEGSPVHVGDQVILVSEKFNRQLFVNNKTCVEGSATPGTLLEVNANINTQSFRLCLYASVSQREQRKTSLVGGAVVRLYSQEREGWISVGTDIHSAKPSLVVVPAKTVHSTGLFMFEFSNNSHGGVASWHDSFRIRHLGTGLYIKAASELPNVRTLGKAIIHQYPLELTPHFEDPASVFQLQSYFAHSKKAITLESTFYVFNVAKKAFFDLTKVDDAGHTTVELSSRAFEQSNLRLVQVPRELCERMDQIKGINTTLERYVRSLQEGHKPERKTPGFKRCVGALKALRRFVVVDGVANADNQQLAMEQGSLRLLYDVLRVPFEKLVRLSDIQDKPNEGLFRIARHAYLAMQAMLRDNAPVSRRAIPYTKFVQAQLGYQLKAADALMELCADNETLLRDINRFMDVMVFVNMIRTRGRLSRYMNFLNALLTCDGRGLPSNQSQILDLLLVRNSEVLLETQLVDQELMVKVDNEWSSLARFLSTSSKELKNYLERQLTVMSNLCVGRHAQSIALVQFKYPYDLLFTGVRATWTREKCLTVCAAFLNVIKTAHVDCDPHLDVSALRLTQDFKRIRTQLPSQPNPPRCNFNALKSDLTAYVRNNVSQCAGATEQNQLSLAVLQLIGELVRVGLYSEDELGDLVPALVTMLNGRTDTRIRGQRPVDAAASPLRFKLDGDHVPLYKCKIEIFRIFQHILKLRQNYVLGQLLTAFRAEYSSGSLNASALELSAPSSAARGRSRVMPWFGSSRQQDTLTQAFKKHELVHAADLVDIVFDLVSYEFHELVAAALKFLFDLFSQRKVALELLARTQLLCSDESVAVYDKAMECRALLCRLANQPTLTPEEEREATNALKVLVGLCTQDDPNKPIELHQKIMRDNDVHLVVMDLLKFPLDPKQPQSERHAVLREAYHFLQVFCRHNPANQNILFSHVDNFLDHMGKGLRVAELLADLLHDNRRVVSMLTESTARYLVSLPCEFREERHLRLLEVLVFNQRHPLKRNQDLVMRLMMEKQDRVMVLFVGEDGRNERARLIERMGSDKDAARLIQYHTYLLRLLALNAKGLNSATELICAGLVPLSECCANVLDASLPPSLRAAYVDFAQEVFICTERKIADMFRKPELWRLLEFFGAELGKAREDGGGDSALLVPSLTFICECFNRHLLGLDWNMRFLQREDIHAPATVRAIANAVRGLPYDGLDDEGLALVRNALHTLSKCVVVNEPVQLVDRAGEVDLAIARRAAAAALNRQNPGLDGSTELAVLAAKERFVARLRSELASQGEDGSLEDAQLRAVFAPSGQASSFRTDRLIQSIGHGYTGVEQMRRQLHLLCSLATGALEGGADVPAQLRLHNQGATEIVFKMLTSEQCHVKSEVLELGIALLSGGNSVIQEWILKTLTHHDQGSRVLFALRDLLREGSHEVWERREHHSKCENIKRAMLDMGEDMPALPEFPFPSIAREVLRFVQLMVEGHNAALQDLLREQPSHTATIDIVSEVLGVLTTVVRCGVHPSNAAIALQALRTLCELCQGPCPTNQNALIASPLPSVCNQILVYAELEDDATVVQLKEESVRVLLALCEGSTTPSLAQQLTIELDLDKIKRLLLDLHGQPRDPDHDIMGLVMDVFRLLRTLGEFEGPVADLLQDKSDHAFASLVHTLSKHTGKVEIVSASGQLFRVFFPIPRICHELTDITKEALMWQVDRSSPDKKVDDFTARFEDLKAEMVHQRRLKRSRAFGLLSPLFKPQQTLLFVLACVVNVCLLFGYGLSRSGRRFLDRKRQCDESSDAATAWGYADCDAWLEENEGELANFDVDINDSLRAITDMCASLILCCSVLNFALYVLQYSSLYVRKRLNTLPSTALLNAPSSWRLVSLQKRLVRAILAVYFLVTDPLFLFNGFKVVFAVLGYINPLFLSFHLLCISEVSPDLQNVMKAVTQNGKSLVLTAVFGVMIIYIYAIFGFVFFRDHYVTDDGGYLCTDLLQCTVTTMSGGLRKGDIGEILQDTEWGDAGLIVWQFTFFVVVITVLLNIIFGIIIDTFGELREIKNQTEEDIGNRCFICSIDRYTIDRHHEQTGGFEHHIMSDHNLWHYLAFAVHLSQTPFEDLTGPEHHVFKCLNTTPVDCSFYPVNQAISLEDTDVDSDQMENALAAHSSALEDIQARQRQHDDLLQSIVDHLQGRNAD